MAVTTAANPTFSVMAGIRSFSILQVLGFALFALTTRFILRGIYRVYFHPLSRFPGPRLSAFTRLPYVIAAATGRPHLYAARLHEQYGDVVRISPDELSFANANAWRDVYGHGPKQGLGSPPVKFWRWYNKPPNGVNSIVTLQDPTVHAKQRRIFLPAFSDRALTQQAPLFTKYADQLVQVLRDSSHKTKAVDIVRLFNFTTLDVMGDLTFGESLHMLDNAEFDPWGMRNLVQIISDSIKRGFQVGLIYAYYPIAAAVVRMFLKKKVESLAVEHMNHSSARVTKRLEKGRESEGNDIWSLVLQSEDQTASLTRDEMISNAQLFMSAGTETTATLLSGLTYILLTPAGAASMKKLKEEVRGAFTSSDQISMEAIQALPFLNACLKEGLRLYPPVPISLLRRTLAQGSTICDIYIPPETTVGVPQWATFRSPKMFKQPLEFIPERWTGDERFVTDDRAAFQPFSFGSRDCVGKNMAYHEMRLILAKVVFNFDLELCGDSTGWADQPVFILWKKKPLMVKVKPASF